jgi:nucleoside-diphosphate-sugar epimerase
MGANMLELFRAVDRGWPLPLGSIRNARTILFVGNLVAAIEAVLAQEQKGCESFFLGDDPPLSTPDLVGAVAAALSVRARLFPFPVALLRLGGSIGDRLSPLFPAAVSGEAVRRLADSLVVDSSRFRSRYNFRPPYDLPEALSETADWYRGTLQDVRRVQ